MTEEMLKLSVAIVIVMFSFVLYLFTERVWLILIHNNL